MRLSTERDRNDARAIGVLHAALDAGVAVLDTADAYCWEDRDVGLYLARGWQLLGLSWRPEIAEEKMSVAEGEACFDRMIAELGVPIDVRYCPHAGGPPMCWCRKPLPGLGALFIQQHRLDAAQSLYVGQGLQDPGFARRAT